jgi:hypothetical protein
VTEKTESGRPRAASVGLPSRSCPARPTEELDRVDLQDVRQLPHDLQTNVGHGPFDPIQVGPVDPCVVGELLLRHPPVVPDASEVGRESLPEVHVRTQTACGLIAHGFKASIGSWGVSQMLDHIFDSLDGWTVLKVAAVLLPVLVFVWIVATVMALHRRDVYFWSLGSTWTSLIACPLAVAITSFCAWRQLKDPGASIDPVPIMAGAVLYVAALAYALLYNFRATRSAALAFSTSMLKQLAVLGLLFLYFRLEGDRVNRRR